MTKILVADDNSNIQKMVGLALKDLGIEVVGVGNGEAAVRKAVEMHPDLVLADVFMPVRNGYEVCSFIKGEPSLAHVPVILLVGAFDPLDEQEAQRVGADGVLKKPFVPPDPLISMVKSALARAAAAAPPPPPPAPVAAPEPAPTVFLPAPEHTELPDIFAGAPQQVEVPEGSQAMAFGNLLDVADDAPAHAPAAAEEDNSFLVARNPHLENQRNWGTPAEAPPPAELPSEVAPEEDTVGTGGWVPEEESTLPHTGTSPVPSYESPALEIDTFQNQAAPPSAPPPPPVAPLPEVETEDDFALESQATTSTYGAPQEELGAAYEFMAPPSAEIAAAVNASAHSAEFEMDTETPAESPAQSSSEDTSAAWTIDAPATAPWDEPAATQEAVWDLDAAPDPDVPESALEHDPSPSPMDAPLSFTAPAVTAPAPPAPAPTSAENDATVARILEKMSPEMLQTVTRELLKPVIQALIQEELDKKK